MNYGFQAKLLKPTAKSCSWCKENNEWSCDVGFCKCCAETLTHRQYLKMVKEDDFRYCKHYRFSKKEFKEWKEMRNKNDYKYMWGEN